MCGRAPCDRPNCSWGEEHRRECEARVVMRWPGEKRTEYYANVKKQRGEPATQELIREVNQQWTISQRKRSLL